MIKLNQSELCTSGEADTRNLAVLLDPVGERIFDRSPFRRLHLIEDPNINLIPIIATIFHSSLVSKLGIHKGMRTPM